MPDRSRKLSRPFEAHALPCSRCGAPLPVDPLARHVYCPGCGSATIVPDDVRAHAREYASAVDAAHGQRDERRYQAQRAARQATQHATSIAMYQMAGGLFVALISMGFAATGVITGWNAVHWWRSGIDEPILIGTQLLIAGGCGVIALAVLVAFVFWLRSAKHARRVRQERQAGMASAFVAAEQAIAGAVDATCSVCGGPLAFQPGEVAVVCPFCGAPVIPCPGHASQLVAMALREADAALLVKHRAERANERKRAESRRSYLTYVTVLLVFQMACLIPLLVPVLGGILLLRRMRWGVEDAVDAFAVAAGSKTERGSSLPYDWLDAYWIDEGPQGILYMEGWTELRWSAYAVYGGRPVLFSAVSDWRDAVASRVTLMVAQPAHRTREHVRRTLASSAAARVHQLGFAVEIRDAGVVLSATDVPAEALKPESVHDLVVAAYGLAGTGTQHLV